MRQPGQTEVVYRTTGDCSIEIGTPKDGRVKLFLSEEEVADVNQAKAKIDNINAITNYAKTTLAATTKPATTTKSKPDKAV